MTVAASMDKFRRLKMQFIFRGNCFCQRKKEKDKGGVKSFDILSQVCCKTTVTYVSSSHMKRNILSTK